MSRQYPPYADMGHGVGLHNPDLSPTTGRQRGRESYAMPYENDADLEPGRQVDLDANILDEYGNRLSTRLQRHTNNFKDTTELFTQRFHFCHTQSHDYDQSLVIVHKASAAPSSSPSKLLPETHLLQILAAHLIQ